jgi:hypothetical protein
MRVGFADRAFGYVEWCSLPIEECLDSCLLEKPESVFIPDWEIRQRLNSLVLSEMALDPATCEFTRLPPRSS